MSEFSTASSSGPILIWQPEGGVPGGPVSNPPIYSQSDVTQLIEGQAYVDVVFGSVQTTEDWVLVACEVENTTDFEPLNIWPGIITDRTVAGFRLQLNGMPDSPNYYLNWAVSGINILPVPATLYLFTGPTSGPFGVDATFTVKLPPSTTLAGSVTITPDDGGAGGSFSPPSVVLSSSSTVQTFIYTAAAYGAATISVTNSSTLVDPASIVFTSIAPVYIFSGPSSGNNGVPSTNFTVQIAGEAVLAMPTTITPHATGGGTFTPTTVVLNTGSLPQHFTYTPSTGGAKTISVTNDGGLTNPANIIYTSVVPFDPTTIAGLKLWLKADALALSDGAAVTAWNDSGPVGYNLDAGTATYKTNIVNSKPVVRFNGTSEHLYSAGLIDTAISQPNSWFVVFKKTTNPAQCIPVFTAVGAGSQVVGFVGTGELYISATAAASDGIDHSGAFHVVSAIITGGNVTGYVDGTQTIPSTAIGSTAVGVMSMMYNAGTYYAGDVAEILLYNSALGTTDRTNMENYLKTKYAIP